MLQSQAHVGASGRATFWRFYMGTWVILASASLAYLALFAASPEAQKRVMARVETELLGTTPPSEPPRTVVTAANPPASEAVPAAEIAAAPATSTTAAAPSSAGEPLPNATKPSEPVTAFEDELASLRTRLARAQEPPPGAQAPSTVAASPLPGEAASDALPPSSPFTTASLPRTRAPSPLPAAVPLPGDAAPAPPETALRAPDTPDRAPANLASPNPATPQPEILNKAPEPQSERATEPRTTRRPGRNLAIIPLREGRLPPLPHPDRTRPPTPQAVAAQPGQPSSFAAPSSYPAPAYSSSGYGVSGDTQPAAPSFGTATVTTSAAAPSGAAALALSIAPSVTGLRASWLLLSSRHGAALAGYQPHYVFDPLTGTYRLLAGPIADRAEADRVCGLLIADDIRCGVTQFSGTPL